MREARLLLIWLPLLFASARAQGVVPAGDYAGVLGPLHVKLHLLKSPLGV